MSIGIEFDRERSWCATSVLGKWLIAQIVERLMAMRGHEEHDVGLLVATLEDVNVFPGATADLTEISRAQEGILLEAVRETLVNLDNDQVGELSDSKFLPRARASLEELIALIESSAA